MADSFHSEQVPFGTDSFADNPEPRCPCLLLLDISGSMSGGWCSRYGGDESQAIDSLEL